VEHVSIATARPERVESEPDFEVIIGNPGLHRSSDRRQQRLVMASDIAKNQQAQFGFGIWTSSSRSVSATATK
jgi:hypothetical protein